MPVKEDIVLRGRRTGILRVLLVALSAGLFAVLITSCGEWARQVYDIDSDRDFLKGLYMTGYDPCGFKASIVLTEEQRQWPAPEYLETQSHAFPEWHLKNWRRIRAMNDRIHEVRLKYDSLFRRQPYVHVNRVREGLLLDKYGQLIGTVGIEVWVYSKVEQDTLPPEDRIPDCLEGVPVLVVERPKPLWVP